MKKFEVGDIIYYSWGYDQTNVDFFQVVVVREKSISIRPIMSKENETGFMSGNSMPIKDAFKGEPMTKRVNKFDYNGNPYISFDYGCGCLWDGSPVSCSWYA